MDKKAEIRFWAKVNKTETCWLWTASIKPNGYGLFQMNGAPRNAHRVAYEWANGPIPQGLQIDHICHVRNCVNPAHLRAVTNKQNSENRIGAMDKNPTGLRGVWPSKKKWRATVRHFGTAHTKYFDDIESADAWARATRLELFTHNDADRTHESGSDL